jgi:hypothetical protein
VSDTRVTDATTLKRGDVVTVAVKCKRDRWQGGGEYWWTRFAAVVYPPFDQRYIHVLTLKLHPTEDDLRTVDVLVDVVHRLPEERWPDGVSAIYMKLLHTGWFKLDDI